MIGGGFVGLSHSSVELFGIDDLGLIGLSVEDSVIQGFAFIEDGEIILGIQANCDGSVAHSVSGVLGLDLVDCFAELEGQVL